MGEFAKSVRYGKTPGPTQKRFNRTEWDSQKSNSTLDAEDKRVLYAGLLFDDLLSYLRQEIRLSEIDLKQSAISRFAIAIATLNFYQINEQTQIAKPKPGEKKSIAVSSQLSKTVEARGGQVFSPDELLTGAGDAMKHMFRELASWTDQAERRTEYEATAADIDNIDRELNQAILYQCAAEYWSDCVGNGYGLAKHEEGIAITPYDPDLEIARIVSIYRRLSISTQDAMAAVESWLHRWPRKAKEKLCEIPLVCRTHGADRIERIELGFNRKALDSTAFGVAATQWLQRSYYQPFMDEPLPKLQNLTLNQIILGWRLLQSLAVSIFDSLGPLENNAPHNLLKYAPRIPRTVLRGTFSKALSIDQESAQLLIDIFVFMGTPSQELWFQPLISMEDDYCLVLTCIHSVHLQRIVEGWMRQGGLDLERKGPEFEAFCRSDLNSAVRQSPIKNSVVVINKDVEFKPRAGRKEEIDIVILIADTVLLIEAKCILWPDDSLQFSNYRDTVEKAVAQISRKRDAVQSDYDSFSERLRQLGYSAPENPKIACCVLTNSAVYSGFPIDNVPIVDLPILGAFFKNEHVKAESRHQGKSVFRHAIQFYKDANEAGAVLHDYLSSPPQLSDTKQFVHKREVCFPVESPAFGKLIQQTFRVEIDSDEMLRRYGPIDEALVN